MGFWLPVLGLLLFSVVSTAFFRLLRRPMLGLAVGTLPVFALWLNFMLQTERSLAECARNVEAFCEWTGIGQFLVTLLAVILVALAAAAATGIEFAAVTWQRANARAAHGPRKVSPRHAGSPLIIMGAGALGLVLGFVSASLTEWQSTFWIVPMLGLGAATIWMVYQEHRFLRG